jgi:hypothetical protein
MTSSRSIHIVIPSVEFQNELRLEDSRNGPAAISSSTISRSTPHPARCAIKNNQSAPASGRTTLNDAADQGYSRQVILDCTTRNP